MLKDLIIFQKAYDFLKWVHVLVGKYPKAEKFVLAARTENAVLDLLSTVIEANDVRDKGPALGRANLALEKTRVWVRLGFELRFMSLKQYEFGSRMIDEIGRLLGGWYKKFGGSGIAAPPKG